jgi:hypothetical protein
MESDDLLCSRNARPPKALVGRAQWKINQPPSLKRMTSEIGGTRSAKFWIRSSENLEFLTLNPRPSCPSRFSRKSRESRANNAG